MNITGIITEYNPFHNGHVYHLNKSREVTDSEYTIVVMSGDFVQRGTPAIMNKYDRAKMALLSGADLVIELPCIYAVSSAEFFAYGAVSLLEDLGCVDSLVFGCETTDLNSLKRTAQLLLEEPVSYQDTLQSFLKQGYSFPSARCKALQEQSCGLSEEFLTSPNTILGIEYLKSLYKKNSTIVPYALKREGAGYHDTVVADDTFPSASFLRNILSGAADLSSIRPYVNKESYSIMEASFHERFPIVPDDLSAVLGYALLSNQSHLSDFFDISEDLSNRILKYLPDYQSFSGFTDLLKTKNYTHTRISRSLLHVILEMKDSYFKGLLSLDHIVPYARILGFRKDASILLKKIADSASIPMISKMADYQKILTEFYDDPKTLYTVLTCFDMDIKASQIYETVCAAKYHTSPVNPFKKGIQVI